MKYLILGCNGMLGHVVSIYLSERGHQVVGVARKDLGIGINTLISDLRDLKTITQIVQDDSYDFIVNCAGLLNDEAERKKANAVAINALLPHFLADITQKSRTRVIHISTDCVFSGKEGGYTEESIRNGLDFYARSKALGEIENQKDITLRTSLVGPDVNPDGIGLFNWFMKQSNGIKGFSKAIWTGQTNVQLAKTIEFASSQMFAGLFNAVPSESIDKFSLLKLFNKYCREDQIPIIADDSVVVDKSLKTIKSAFLGIIPDYETMVAEMSQWINTHSTLYPYYY